MCHSVMWEQQKHRPQCFQDLLVMIPNHGHHNYYNHHQDLNCHVMDHDHHRITLIIVFSGAGRSDTKPTELEGDRDLPHGDHRHHHHIIQHLNSAGDFDFRNFDLGLKVLSLSGDSFSPWPCRPLCWHHNTT